ncbi:probable disease resistance protein At5g63020 [Papaver somniferum]|uniref:probable disease resistance protein At5g63020 n=1 Tax=Papaver somniferum TaxID=3469 RepID=UPI000E6F96A7|nr:probable disease resistance protein At5g63020 [Papaver somniferum]
MKLKERRDDVKERVHTAESNQTEPAKRTHEVSGWMQRVEMLEQEIESILQECVKNERRSYFCCWGRKNCCIGYKLGKIVVELLNDADKFCNEGVFQVLVDKSQPDIVREIATTQAVGIESNLEEIWSLLADEESLERIIGLYGMGGVGKTTLLKNLNNKFLKRNHHFDKIIWVVVSKDIDIQNIQKQIGKLLGLSWSEETNIDDRAKDITEVLKNKKFVLFLDDIWERVDLATVGIPDLTKDSQEMINISRVVFTTRSESVCGLMEADTKIKVDCLQWGEAWILFQEKVGQQELTNCPNILEIAKQVAKECLGLPLALVTIGRTMASKTTLPQWQYALTVLQKSASEFSGMAEEVLAKMKFSYDNLPTEKLKSCFLYCSLYPEDYSIIKVDLIRLWIGEGFLDEVYNEGHDVIENLKGACLLETGFFLVNGDSVKMHDVVRDLAIWIVSDLGGKKGKYLTIQAKNKLKLHKWEKAEKISLVGNESIGELNGAPNCLNLSTLLLQDSKAQIISDDFFRSMPMLKVLDMSKMEISDCNKLPASIFSLTELQYFDLSFVYCKHIYIDLSPGTLVCLTKLKMLNFYCSNTFNWEVEGGPSLSELECLNDLNYLGIKIGTSHALQRLASSHKLQLCTNLLQIYRCQDITTLVLSPLSLPAASPISSLVSLGNMVGLKTLQLDCCWRLEELRIVSWVGMEDKATLFTSLEILQLFDMPELKIAWHVAQQSLFCFVNLKQVSIWCCPKLKDVTWLIYAQNLETLDLEYLDGLEEIISDGLAAKEKLKTTFSRLNSLSFFNIPKLKRICNHNVEFLCLEHIEVNRCPELKKLPFNTNSVIPRTLGKIEGDKKWWESLEWEDEATKSNLAPYFCET